MHESWKKIFISCQKAHFIRTSGHPIGFRWFNNIAFVADKHDTPWPYHHLLCFSWQCHSKSKLAKLSDTHTCAWECGIIISASKKIVHQSNRTNLSLCYVCDGISTYVPKLRRNTKDFSLVFIEAEELQAKNTRARDYGNTHLLGIDIGRKVEKLENCQKRNKYYYWNQVG